MGLGERGQGGVGGGDGGWGWGQEGIKTVWLGIWGKRDRGGGCDGG